MGTLILTRNNMTPLLFLLANFICTCIIIYKMWYELWVFIIFNVNNIIKEVIIYSFSGAYALLMMTDDEDDYGGSESVKSNCNCKCLAVLCRRYED